MDDTNGFTASNRSSNHLERGSNCSLTGHFAEVKSRRKGKIGNVFNDSAITSGSTVKWTTPMDSRRQIGLETAWKGVLIVV